MSPSPSSATCMGAIIARRRGPSSAHRGVCDPLSRPPQGLGPASRRRADRRRLTRRSPRRRSPVSAGGPGSSVALGAAPTAAIDLPAVRRPGTPRSAGSAAPRRTGRRAGRRCRSGGHRRGRLASARPLPWPADGPGHGPPALTSPPARASAHVRQRRQGLRDLLRRVLVVLELPLEVALVRRPGRSGRDRRG